MKESVKAGLRPSWMRSRVGLGTQPLGWNDRIVRERKHDDIARDLAAIELHGRAIKANIGDMVPPTAVRATAHFNMNLLG